MTNDKLTEAQGLSDDVSSEALAKEGFRSFKRRGEVGERRQRRERRERRQPTTGSQYSMNAGLSDDASSEALAKEEASGAFERRGEVGERQTPNADTPIRHAAPFLANHP
jgi:hypothetical protein